MAVNILNSSTLSEALGKDANEVTVASTANISVGNYLAIQGTGGLEVVEVQAIPVSGRVQIMRGQGGTRARAHKSGTKFFIGTPDLFQSIKAGIVAGVTGDPSDFGDYLFPGYTYRDGAGNEYILVELTQTVVPGATVVISRDGNYTASVVTATSQGRVGIVVENSSSDQYAWVQICGFYDHAKLVGGSSLVTSLGEFQGASSVSTPSVGLLGRSSSQRTTGVLETALIWGMFPQSAASTASTSASSETGFFTTVYLHYPYIIRPVTS